MVETLLHRAHGHCLTVALFGKFQNVHARRKYLSEIRPRKRVDLDRWGVNLLPQFLYLLTLKSLWGKMNCKENQQEQQANK
ncbi:MAG: hypothetical protein A2V98_20955 [Planctomycetes bacterium RBG_16_64_12]|nr:MAG: hypothetical protein A2V98_20955 [Planctomycetes bacterium RBG_16_64_12]